jgi:hypothetical protein
MADNGRHSWSQVSKLVFYCVTAIYVVIAITAVVIFRNPEWHPHLVKFMARVWHAFVSYNAGSTGPGFFSSILVSILGIVIFALFIGYLKGFEAMTEHTSENAALAIIGVVTVVLLVYGTQFAWEVAKVGYEDHATLAAKVASLKGENSRMVDPSERDSAITNLQDRLKESQTQLESRKQMIVVGDPAFDNLRKILTAFQAYRIASKGQKCVVYITAPPSSERIASLVATFSNSVSSCFTSGPSGPGNPDLDEITKTGMKNGLVLIHAPRGELAANLVEEHLSGTIPLERSYKPLASDSPLYQDQGTGEMVLWLQFGPDVRWTSDHTAKGNP